MNNFWKAERTENGYELNAIACEGDTLDATTKLTPKGAYTTFRTYDHYGVLRLTRHFNRLEETSRLAGFEVSLDRAALKKVLVECIDSFGAKEQRVRITIDLSDNIGCLYIAVEKLHVPDEKYYLEGIDAGMAEMHRDNPKAKLSNFLDRAASVRAQVKGDYEEIIMFSPEGDMLEGLSSNFYGIMGGKLYTAEEGVLSGTTRDFVLSIARELGVDVVLRPVNLSQLGELEEAFITSTSRSILPIRTIDGKALLQSAPGAVTRRLMDAFKREIDSQIELLNR